MRLPSIGFASRYGCVNRIAALATQPFDVRRNEQRNRSRLTQPFAWSALIRSIIVAVLMFALLGCEQVQQTASDSSIRMVNGGCIFSPQKIKFNQLTELTGSQRIIAYIDVFDQFDSRIKAAGVWQFELYEYAVRSANPMGSRIRIWDNIELTEAKINNAHWREYLHCYQFELNLESELGGGKTYILQAVCFTADGKRIIDTIELKS